MKIGIIGSGSVGQTIGAKLTSLGHQVKIGTRDPQKLADWVSGAGANATAGSFEEAAAFGEVIVIATRWENGATENAIRLANPANFSGKVVIDITNPLDFSKGMPPGLAVGGNDSAAENIQRWLPDAKVVKALNIVTAAVMVDPSLTGDEPDMFIAGNDSGAKAVVTDILKSFGWKSIIDFGGIEAARYIEPVCNLWVIYWQQSNGWAHAFKIVGKPTST